MTTPSGPPDRPRRRTNSGGDCSSDGAASGGWGSEAGGGGGFDGGPREFDGAPDLGARGRPCRGGSGSDGDAVGSGGASGFGGRGHGRRRIRGCVLLLAGLLAALLALLFGPISPFRSHPAPTDWILAMCDVGQGDGLALAAGPGRAIVIDTGPDPAKMDGCLADLGVHRIPLLLLTHFHADHVDGLPGALAGRSVGEIETTDLADPPVGAAKVRTWAAAAGVRIGVVRAGEHRTYGAVSWDVLWPSGHAFGAGGRRRRRSGGAAEEGSAPNNASIVLRVRVDTSDGPVGLLLTGDIEPPAQQALLAAHPDLAADILKVPHHGSRYQEPQLIQHVRPRVALISVGEGNTYGHPAADTLRLAASTGARVLRTDRDGEVVVFGSARSLRVMLRGRGG